MEIEIQSKAAMQIPRAMNGTRARADLSYHTAWD